MRYFGELLDSAIIFDHYDRLITTGEEKKRFGKARKIHRYEGGFHSYGGPVPRSICDLIKETYETEEKRKFVFTLVSHVIGSGGRALAPDTLIQFFPEAPRRTDERSDWAEESLSILERTEHNRLAGKARIYSLRPEVKECMNEDRRYILWSDFINRRAWKDRPTPVDKEDIQETIDKNGLEIILDEEFQSALDRLSKRPILFDRTSAIGDEKVQADGVMRSFVDNLAHGECFTCYSLQSSGRIGTRSVNLQGLNNHLRQYVKAPEGFKHLYFDYSAQEPRILAYLSGDTRLGEMLEDNTLYERLEKELVLGSRSNAKRIFNSIVYGVSALTLSKDFGITIGAAININKAINDSFPTAFSWQKEQAKEIKATGYAITIGGTKRTVFDLDKRNRLTLTITKRQGVNHIIQGTAADICRKLIVEFDKHLPEFGAHLLLPVHDGFLIELPIDKEENVTKTVLGLMEDVPKQLMPKINLPVKIQHGWYAERSRDETPIPSYILRKPLSLT